MIVKNLKTWAQEKGYSTIGDTAMKTENGYLVSYGVFADRNVTVSTTVDAAAWNADIQKAVKKELRRVGALQYRKGVVSVTVSAFGQKKLFQKLEAATEALTNALRQNGVRGNGNCLYCGLSGCDDFTADGAVAYPSHSACKNAQAQKIYDEVAQNHAQGNYTLSILCALLGGLIGCIPSFLSIYFAEMIYGLLFALIPLAAYWGYKLGKGVMSRGVPFIIAPIALLDTAALVLILEYIYAAQEFEGLGFSEFLGLCYEYQIFGDIFLDWIEVFAFCAIGIAIAWSAVSRGNRHRLKQAQLLQSSVAANGSASGEASVPVSAETEE